MFSLRTLSLFLPGNNIKQSGFVIKLSTIMKKYVNPYWDRMGVCNELGDLYIEYAEKNETGLFFSELQQLYNCDPENIKDVEKVIGFARKINKVNMKFSHLLNNKPCLDSFAFAAEDAEAFRRKMEKIIGHLKKYSQNLFVKGTFGHIHAFVLEQRVVENNFTYYLYDANNPYFPEKLTTLDEIVNEMNLVVDRIKTSEFFNSLLYGNDKKLVSLCVYPGFNLEQEDKCIKALQANYNEKINQQWKNTDTYSDAMKGAISEPMADIDLLLFKYKENDISRSVLLSNLAVCLNKISVTTGIDFSDELQIINKELTLHITSMDLMNNDITDASIYFESFSDPGKTSLLHEVMRHGDIKAAQYLQQYLSPFIKNNIGSTPFSIACSEGHSYLVRDLLENITDDIKYHVETIRNLANNFANKTVSTNNELHAIFKILIEKKRALDTRITLKNNFTITQ